VGTFWAQNVLKPLVPIMPFDIFVKVDKMLLNNLFQNSCNYHTQQLGVCTILDKNEQEIFRVTNISSKSISYNTCTYSWMQKENTIYQIHSKATSLLVSLVSILIGNITGVTTM